jgi:uncharacterized protein
MDKLERILNMDLKGKQSAFLWGPKKTGKSSFLKKTFPKSLYYDFHEPPVFEKFSQNLPSFLREELAGQKEIARKYPVILDGLDRLPQLQEEIRRLIENEDMRFILCCSGKKGLKQEKRGQPNFFGSNIRNYEMFPLTSAEIGEIDLLKVLNRGMLPVHYFQDNYLELMRSYFEEYMEEELFKTKSALYPEDFKKFFKAMGDAHGQWVHYEETAQTYNLDANFVRNYYLLLVDTFMGTLLKPIKKVRRRSVINSIPKFFLFDVGLANALTGRVIKEEKGELFEEALKHFILMELLAHRSYKELDYEINYWMTTTRVEVDFVLAGGEVAIHVNGADRVDHRNLRSLFVFDSEYSPKHCMLVCNEKKRRVLQRITIIPWREFLDDLWSGKIIG